MTYLLLECVPCLVSNLRHKYKAEAHTMYASVYYSGREFELYVGCSGFM